MEKECAEIVEVAEGPSVCASPERRAERHAAAVQEAAAYGIKVWIDRPYDKALEMTRSALSNEGFGIISETDVRKLFQEKLNLTFPHYAILEACRPEWMHQALELDRDIGLLLPCSLVVYEQNGGAIVEAIDPIAQFAIADSTDLQDLARAIKQSLQDVIDHVAAGRA